MIENEFIEFDAIEVIQPIGKSYVGCIDHKDLTFIAYVDELRIERREVEKYLGVERPLSKERVNELIQYVNTIDAAFPTSIIIAVSSDDTEYDGSKKRMKLKKKEAVAQVIDGQHRIAGLRGYLGNNFKLNVTIFVDMDIEDQAMVFATINLEQTKVNRSIAYSLYEYAKSRSPYKTSHNIAKLLNSKTGSPFESKIKILGRATPGITSETLTQATFVKLLLPMISDNPVGDRDTLKRGKKLKSVDPTKERKRIFINMFREERDAETARILWNYFLAVQERWGKAWKEARSGNILNRTAGFTGLMYFLPRAYLSLGKPGQVISTRSFGSIFRKIKLKDEDFNPTRFVPGATGERGLFMDLCKQSGLSPQ